MKILGDSISDFVSCVPTFIFILNGAFENCIPVRGGAVSSEYAFLADIKATTVLERSAG